MWIIIGYQAPKIFEIAFHFSRLSYVIFLVVFSKTIDLNRILSTEHIKDIVSKNGDKKAESRLNNDIAMKTSKLIDKKIIEERFFLEPDISLRDLADQIGIGTHELSEVLNRHMKTSFYSYINSQRIIYAKKLLAETNDFIVDIAVNSGFSSRSSFYSMFKKNYGVTPKKYRETISAEKADASTLRDEGTS